MPKPNIKRTAQIIHGDITLRHIGKELYADEKLIAMVGKKKLSYEDYIGIFYKNFHRLTVEKV